MPEVEPGTIQRFNQAILLYDVPRRGGKIEPTVRANLKHALLRTLVDISWQQNADNSVDPLIRLRLEPRRLLCDLLVRAEDAYPAARWRVEIFDGMKFRKNVESAVEDALSAWERKEFDKAYVATYDSFKIMDAERASDLKPRRA